MSHSRWRYASLLLVLINTIFIDFSHADNDLPKWELGLGVAAARLADYRGSQHGHTYAVPIPYGIYRGEKLRLDRDQNRFRIFQNATVSVDWSALVSQPVDSKDSPRRTDMPNLKPTLEWGPRLQLNFDDHWSFQTRVHVVSDIENEKLHERGVTVTPAISMKQPLDNDFSLNLLLSSPFASWRYNDYYYGVAESYARNDRSAYDAHGGWSGINTQISLSKRTHSAWYGIFVSNHFLNGTSISDSPLIDDHTTWSAGFAVTWLLMQSHEHAEPDKASDN